MARRSRKSSSGNDAVGYGKPPIRTRLSRRSFDGASVQEVLLRQ
jgi:hypothetical protein